MPVVAVAPVVDVPDPPDTPEAERDGDGQAPPVVPGRAGVEPRAVDRPRRWPGRGPRPPGRRRGGRPRPAARSPPRGTTAERPGPPSPGQLARAPLKAKATVPATSKATMLDGQLPGDPTHGEAGHGEGLPPDREEGVDRQDRDDHADCEEHPGHPSIQHGPRPPPVKLIGRAGRWPAGTGDRAADRGGQEEGQERHGTTERARRQLPLPRDPEPPHARGHDPGLRPVHRARAATPSSR